MKEVACVCSVVVLSVIATQWFVGSVWTTGGGDPIVSDEDYRFVSPEHTIDTVPKARPASDFTR